MSVKHLFKIIFPVIGLILLSSSCKQENPQTDVSNTIEVQPEDDDPIKYTYSKGQMEDALLVAFTASNAVIKTQSDGDDKIVFIKLTMPNTFEAEEALQKRILEEVGHVAAVHVANPNDFKAITIDLYKEGLDARLMTYDHIFVVQ
jgi:hypothetical protein